MILSGDPIELTPGSPQYPLVLSCGPGCWDVRVAGYVVSVLALQRTPQEEVLDFATEQIQLWQAKKVLAS